jgi:putative transposase
MVSETTHMVPAKRTQRTVALVRMLAADSGISKSEVSRICADLDAEVGTFRDAEQY